MTAIPSQRSYESARSAFRRYRDRGSTAPAEDDRDRRPITRYHDGRPRPTRANFPAGWTKGGVEQHKAQRDRAVAVLASLQVEHRIVAELESQLAAARERAVMATDLAAAHGRVADLSAKLLDRASFSEATTEALDMRRATEETAS